MGSSWQIFTSGSAGGEPEQEVHVRPAWFGPAEEEVGRAVDVATVLARSDQGVVVLTHAVAYSNGVQLHLLARATGLKRFVAASLFHQQHELFDPDEGLPDGFLRFGLELPDGSRVSNLEDPRRRGRWDEEPAGAFLVMNGGAGGSALTDTVDMRPAYWLWPLVEEGTVRFSCEWPIVGIPFTTVEVDTAPLLDAASRVIRL